MVKGCVRGHLHHALVSLLVWQSQMRLANNPMLFLRPLEVERIGVNGYAAHRYDEDLPEP